MLILVFEDLCDSLCLIFFLSPLRFSLRYLLCPGGDHPTAAAANAHDAAADAAAATADASAAAAATADASTADATTTADAATADAATTGAAAAEGSGSGSTKGDSSLNELMCIEHEFE